LNVLRSYVSAEVRSGAKPVPLDDQRTRISFIVPNVLIGAAGRIEMITDLKHRPRQDDVASDKRRHQEEDLDDALKNTFPASDPVSVEQPTTSGRACRS